MKDYFPAKLAQESQHISFVFSGSNRRLLLELFDDKSKPLYMLCDRLKLTRMTVAHYYHHIQKLAKKRWGLDISDVVFNKIMILTECHPYYVNLLCNSLWQGRALPEVSDVLKCWEQQQELHEDRLIAEIQKLTVKQQDFLKALAVMPTSEPTGQQFAQKAAMASSSINQIMHVLKDKDMIYQVKVTDERTPQMVIGQHRVLDPLLGHTLRRYA